MYACCEHCIHWGTDKIHQHPNPCSYIVNLDDAAQGEVRMTCQS